MGKILKVFMTLLLLLSVGLVIGCKEEETQLPKIKVLLPSGAPLMSIGGLIGDESFEFEFANGAEALSAALIKEDYDMIIAPLNLGAKLYLANTSKYKVASVLTTNNTYLVSKNEITSIADLADKNILAYGKNSTPDIILQAAITKHNVANVTRNYQSTVGDVLSLFTAGNEEATYSLLAEPQVTILKNKNPNLYVIDLAKEVDANGVFPQACLFVKAESSVDYAKHLELIKQNVEELNNNPEDYAAKVENKHQFFTNMKKEVLAKALPNCNIVYLEAKTNQDVINNYINLLNTYAKALLGGKTVDEGFYY